MPKVVDHEERRSEVAEAVWRAIARLGLDGTTVREIAAEAGYSTGVLSHYFRDKDELVLHALGASIERTSRRIGASARARPALAALRGVMLDLLPLSDDSRTEFRVVLSFWPAAAANERLRAEHRALYRVFQDLLERLVASGRRDGSISPDCDPLMESQSLMAFLDGLCVHGLLDPERMPADRQHDLLEHRLAALRPNP